tara:strand:+ start:617 stop:1072 length:456 start_codon:yes stop_codon:yes gene_type:complete
MSKKTPSQDFSYEFEVVFDKEKETTLQKIKRWINKKEPPLRTILSYLFSYVEKWYWDGKLKQTMSGVDSEVERMREIYGKQQEPKPKLMETGVFGEEGWSISISNSNIERGSKGIERSMVSGSNEKRLSNKFPDPWEGDWNDGVYFLKDNK